MKKVNKKFILLFASESIVFFMIYLYHINSLYAMVMSEDELGYWGNAAHFAGLDWGNVLNNTAYYSYGYSFILLLILKLPLSSLVMYRLAIILNAIFMLISFIISEYLFWQLFPNKNKYFINIVCFTGVLYSGYIGISNFVLTECFLVMLTWALLLQSFLICKKRSWKREFIFCLELCFIYVVHMRTLTYVIAGMIFLMYISIDRKHGNTSFRKKIGLYAFEFIFVFVIIYISSYLKNHLQEKLYVSDIAANDYEAIIKSISWSNIFLPFLSAMCGEAFYLWTSTLGFLPIGFVYSCKKFIYHKTECSSIKCFYVFMLLMFLGEFALSTFVHRSVGPVYRLDYLVYGRYVEISIPFLLIVGLMHFPNIVKCRKEVCCVMLGIIIYWVLAYFLNSRVEKYNLADVTSYQGACSIGIFWLYFNNGFNVYLFYKVVSLIQVIFLIILCVFKQKFFCYFIELLLVIIYWITNAYCVLENQTIPYQNRYCYGLTEEADFFEELNLCKYEIGFISGAEYSTRGNIQLYLMNTPLICIDRDFEVIEKKSLPDILIIEYRGIVDNIDKQINKLKADNAYYYAGEMGNYQVYVHTGISLKSL